MNREEIDKLSYGQDIPELLQYTPVDELVLGFRRSGSNYSYFSMRGIQQTRINMTFDGAPLNDPAEHAVYFNNFHDFSNAVDSIQIQRGCRHLVGRLAFVRRFGQLRQQAPALPGPWGGDLRLVLGSFDTLRASVAYESGDLRQWHRFSVGGQILFCRYRRL